VQDRIHQPYRSGLIENCDTVFRVSYELGSLGTYVSGAGPTIISMIDAKDADAFGKSMEAHLCEKNMKDWRVEIHSADHDGAKIVIE